MQLSLGFDPVILQLPNRYELLERKLGEIGGDIGQIVRKVDAAVHQVNSLLHEIHSSGCGQFQLFVGLPGSGKTTFFKTLPNFFDDIEVIQISEEVPLGQVVASIQKFKRKQKHTVFILINRDNPVVDPQDLRAFFEALRMAFRQENGNVLVTWPITDIAACKIIGDIAFEIGRDSIIPSSGPSFEFKGVPKNEFYSVADTTTINLNTGRNLESFGIHKEDTEEIENSTETIGAYFKQLQDLSAKINKHTLDLLKEKVTPKLWIVLVGDDAVTIDRTVSSLTTGIESKVDIARICAFLDDPQNKSAYLTEWRKKRKQIAYLMQFLDVRVFGMTPTIALACVRSFGTESIRKHLKKQSATPETGIDQIKRSGFYEVLTNSISSSKKSDSATSQDTAYEYRRVQSVAGNNQDRELNKAISTAIESALKQDQFSFDEIVAEKQQLISTTLKPDIQLKVNDKHIICLEFTWRSTGEEVPGEVEKKQNSLSKGHLQQYMLDKVAEYVKEFGLDS